MNKKGKKFLALCLVSSMVVSNMLFTTAFASTKHAGANRYETAAKVAKAGWTSADVAILATGEDFPDALSAAPLAAANDAPILLTGSAALDSYAKDALTTLGVDKVIIVGGEKAVSAAVVTALESAGITVERIAGTDRYNTSVKVAEELGTSSTVVLANGYSFADALSVSPIAAAKGMPILLTAKDSVSADVKSFIGDKDVVVVGGSAAISSTAVSGLNVEETLAGTDRYATNKEILEYFANDIDFANVFLATGLDYPDALAGSAYAAKLEAPVVLVGSSLDAGVKSFLADNVNANTNVIALGGASTVANAASALEDVTNPDSSDFEVKSVTAINGRQIEVVFSNDIDDTTFGSVVVTPQSGAGATGGITTELGKDDKTLLITSAAALTKDGYYRVDVTGVQNTDLETIDPYSEVIKVADTTVPTIKKVSGTTSDSSTRSFKVTFSEPVYMDLVKVTNDEEEVVATATPVDSTYNDEYTISIPNTADELVAGHSYNFKISGLRDFANNYANSTVTSSVAIVQDTVKPTFKIEPVNPKEFKIVFDKDMSSTVPVDAVVVTDDNDTEYPLATLPVRQSDKRTFKVTLAASPIPSDKTSKDLTATVKGFEDTVGNEVNKKDVDFTLTKEDVKPTITNARMVPSSNNSIEVTFSEKVTGLATSNFVLTNADKDVVGGTITPGTLNSDNKVILTLGTPLTKSGKYTLALKVNEVTDASGNKNNAVTKTIDFTPASVTQLHATITSTTDGSVPTDSTVANRLIYISFDQSVVNGISDTTGNYKDGAAENPANYTVDGAVLPEGATVTYTSGSPDYVVIDLSAVADDDLPTAFLEGGDVIVTVSNVKSEDDALLQYTSATVTVADATAATIKSGYMTMDGSDYVITLVMSEKIDSASADLADFTLNVNAAGAAAFDAADTIAVSSSDARKVIITVKNATEKTAIAAHENKVVVNTVASPVSTDLNSIAIDGNGTVNVTDLTN